MRVSSYVLLVAFATSSPSSAFTPCSLYRTAPHQQQTNKRKTRRFAKDEKTTGEGAAPAAPKGVPVGKAIPFVAPLAALAAGRQAMEKRELIQQERAITEADLARIKDDLVDTETAIQVRCFVDIMESVVV